MDLPGSRPHFGHTELVGLGRVGDPSDNRVTTSRVAPSGGSWRYQLDVFANT